MFVVRKLFRLLESEYSDVIAHTKIHIRAILDKRRKSSTVLAEEVGFEPTVPLRTTVFKTAAFGRSATPPRMTFSSAINYHDIKIISRGLN